MAGGASKTHEHYDNIFMRGNLQNTVSGKRNDSERRLTRRSNASLPSTECMFDMGVKKEEINTCTKQKHHWVDKISESHRP